MSPMLTDLMQQLQDVHTYHPGDDGRLMVAVSTTPHTIEQFEVGKSTMTDSGWSCTAGPSRMNSPGHRMNSQGHRMNSPGHRMNKPGPLREKPGLASITTTRICPDEVGRP